jgi:hypothetical protein
LTTSPRSTIGCAQNDFHAHGTFGTNNDLSCAEIKTIPKRIEMSFPLDPCLLGVQSRAPKMISEPVVHLAQTVHLTCVKINSISKWPQNEFPLDPHHVGVQSVAPKMIYEPMVRSAQTAHLSCVEINTISKWTETSFHFTHMT